MLHVFGRSPSGSPGQAFEVVSCGATSIEDTFFEVASFKASSFEVASFGASSYEAAPSKLPPSSARPSKILGDQPASPAQAALLLRPGA